MRSFTICICNENSILLNNYTFLIKVYDMKFFSTFESIKYLIFRILKNVIIVTVQIKIRDLRFRNFKLNVIMTNIKFELFSFYFRDDFVSFIIRRI